MLSAQTCREQRSQPHNKMHHREQRGHREHRDEFALLSLCPLCPLWLPILPGGQTNFAPTSYVPSARSRELIIRMVLVRCSGPVPIRMLYVAPGRNATGDATFSSDVGSDVIVGNQVTFTHASPHRLTATVSTTSGSVLVQVAALPLLLAVTGAALPFWPVAPALGAVVVGAGLLLRRPRLRPVSRAR